jgi:hypothetical protein
MKGVFIASTALVIHRRITGVWTKWHSARSASMFNRCEPALQKCDFRRRFFYPRLPPTKQSEISKGSPKVLLDHGQ